MKVIYDAKGATVANLGDRNGRRAENALKKERGGKRKKGEGKHINLIWTHPDAIACKLNSLLGAKLKYEEFVSENRNSDLP